MSVFRSKSEILLLEPCDGKLSRTVLRGESARKGADLPAPAYVSYLSADSYLRSENQLALTLVWRFSGGKKTRKYDRQSESVDLFE